MAIAKPTGQIDGGAETDRMGVELGKERRLFRGERCPELKAKDPIEREVVGGRQLLAA